MADLGFVFDPESAPVDEPRNFEPIPAGDYNVQITDSEVFDLKSGNGKCLKLTLQVMDGPHEGRLIWDRLNVRHSSELAQDIAQRQLGAIFRALGIHATNDTELLHGRPLVAKVAVRVDSSGQYAPQNEVKGYKPRGSQSPAAPAAKPALRPVPSAPAPVAAAAGDKPWLKKAAAQQPPF